VAEDGAFIAHEWGTFTTRHGSDGVAMAWNPLLEVSDLPRFVFTGDGPSKVDTVGTVRMETPVIYFYSAARQIVSVDVGFPGGVITEWYPRARLGTNGIQWPRVTILPQAAVHLPRGRQASHYYPARETDAAVVRVRGAKRAQYEKFLFYRGVGTFALPVTARRDGDQVVVHVGDGQPIAQVMLFERRGAGVGHRTAAVAAGDTVVACPTLTPTALDGFESDLRSQLVGAGLYEREAQAMLETWRTTWSEDGLRVFYLVPREVTDAVLPLTITPAPSEVVRVLVGRAELL
jgi:hypothetical protein